MRERYKTHTHTHTLKAEKEMKEGVVCLNFPSRESAAAAPPRQKGGTERKRSSERRVERFNLCLSLSLSDINIYSLTHSTRYRSVLLE